MTLAGFMPTPFVAHALQIRVATLETVNQAQGGELRALKVLPYHVLSSRGVFLFLLARVVDIVQYKVWASLGSLPPPSNRNRTCR